MTSPLGVQLNNPGNLKHGVVPFRGEVVPGGRHGFAEFESPTMGFRAMARVLLTYFRRYGFASIDKIAPRYAPASQNDTEEYARNVAAELRVTTGTLLKLDDPLVLERVVRAMTQQETGLHSWLDGDLVDGVLRAFE